jgi:GWxTD domain-containing protein
MGHLTRMRRFQIAIRNSGGIVFLLTLGLSLALLFAAPPPAAAQKKKPEKQKLEKSYQEWLERDVAYIITREEKNAFLKLPTNDARDQFIQSFWEIRNPDPGSPENTYKDEIYQRISYANAHFGAGANEEGWRTDRGRAYITLGPPQQKEVHYNAANLFPIEIWFYSFNHPSLPPFFYIMFYKHEGFGDFRFYSPFVDGPDKLVTGTEYINDRQGSIQAIQNSVGPLVAHLSQSLIPNEPIDPTEDRPSLQSDAMLATIKGLADNPFTKQDLDRRRALVENVTARLLIPGQNLDVATLPLRDSRGVTRVDYAMRFRQPSDASLAQRSDGRFAFNLEAQVKVFDSDHNNQLIFTQEKRITDAVAQEQLEDVKHSRIGYEGSLPLPPGKFHLEFILTDWEHKKALQASKDVIIPEISGTAVVISGVLPFASVKPVDPGTPPETPFTLGGLKFVPLGTNPLTLAQDEPMQVAYQIWARPQDPANYADQKMTVEYAVGRPAVPGGALKVSEDIAKQQFDPSGSMVSGKKLPLAGQPTGNYMLSIAIDQPGAPQSAFSTLLFSVTPEAAARDVWDLTDSSIEKDSSSGVPDRERALCLLSLGKQDESRAWFRRALSRNHSDEISRSRLVDAYYARKDYAAILSLYKDVGITDQTDPDTLLRIAESFSQTGELRQAISLLESALRTNDENGPLYLALAGYYRKAGDAAKAADLEAKGKSRMAPAGTR